MRLHTVAKMGGIISVILFIIGVGVYGFVKLTEVGDGKNIDLLTLIPSSSVRVLETDNLEYFSNEFPQTSYAERLDSLGQSGIVNSIIRHILMYSSEGAHRLGNQMNHLYISLHAPVSDENVVVYFRMSKESKRLLARIFSEKEEVMEPKRVSYRGESLTILPYRKTKFLTVYSGKGFLAVSYQKRLIEEVIDAQKDGTSLKNDMGFSKFLATKSANFYDDL